MKMSLKVSRRETLEPNSFMVCLYVLICSRDQQTTTPGPKPLGHNPWTSPPPVFVNKVLLEHS